MDTHEIALLKLECLKLARDILNTGSIDSVTEAAKKMYEFLTVN